MSYIVGIDLRDARDGVTRFAGWFRKAGGCEGLVGVHVVHTEEGGKADADLMRGARTALEAWVDRAGVAREFDELVVIEGSRIADALHAACIERATDGLIVGRRAGQDERGWVRLGATTRRLLRLLPAPVVVVPPDLDPATLGSGPVVVAVTAAEDASLAAYRYAEGVARQLQRELELARVAHDSHRGLAYLTGRQAAELQERRRARTEQGLAEWMRSHGIEAPARVLTGSSPEQLLVQVDEGGCPLVVCGRNKANMVQRWFGGTTATELATFSRVPVAVVAPKG